MSKHRLTRSKLVKALLRAQPLISFDDIRSIDSDLQGKLLADGTWNGCRPKESPTYDGNLVGVPGCGKTVSLSTLLSKQMLRLTSMSDEKEE